MRLTPPTTPKRSRPLRPGRTGEGPLTAEAAQARILALAAPLTPEPVELPEGTGRTLAEDIRARLDSPPFTNSARDGYAVRATDLGHASKNTPASLPVSMTVTAGGPIPPPLAPGRAARIMTGAPLPNGADSVVMDELTRADGGRVFFFHAPTPGEHVRTLGEDFRRGEPLLAAGTSLRPWEIALLASQGLTTVNVRRRPHATLVVTGDEVTAAGDILRPGALYDANGPALSAALTRAGAVPAGVFHAPDDPVRLRTALNHALAQSDVVLVSGGVSVGDRDHTRAAFSAVGARELFWRVAIRPGGPLLAAVTRDGKFLFGLPGNPLSALVCFEEFAHPLLRALQGLPPDANAFPHRGRAANAFRKPAGLRQYLFVRREGDRLHIPPQGSALLRSAAGADALAVAPLGLEEVLPGDELSFKELP